ncbi:MAG: hypothetical protein L6Q65_12240, partial [Zoogloea sp.]|nr:hypothetical protein [Zoogloea sp.]
HNLLERRKSRVDALAQHLAHLDPRGVLARGYSITRNAAGEIVRDASTLAPGSGIRVELHQGSVNATVTAHDGPASTPQTHSPAQPDCAGT